MGADPSDNIRLFNLGMRILFVVAFFAILSTVLLAVILVVVPLLPPPHVEEPSVQLQVGFLDPYEIRVVGVSTYRDLMSYKAYVLRNGTMEGPAMDPVQDGRVGIIAFNDLDGGGYLSVGDFFTIECMPESDYRLVIIWKDSGNERGSIQWWT